MKKQNEIEFHKLANLFPLMEGEQWESFKESIRVNGVVKPIIMYEGKILDGRNRYRAAEELGMEYRVENYPGDDPLNYVKIENFDHRHLTEAQRAMIGAKMANLPHGGAMYAKKSEETAGAFAESMTLEGAANLVGLSKKSIAVAKKIQKEATPEVIHEVEQGRMSLNAALNTVKAAQAKVEEFASDNVVQLPVEKLTKRQADVRSTKEYKALLSKYNKLNVRVGFLESENRTLTDEIMRLKAEYEKLGDASKTSN